MEQTQIIARNPRIEFFLRTLSSRSTYDCRTPEFHECDEKVGSRAEKGRHVGDRMISFFGEFLLSHPFARPPQRRRPVAGDPGKAKGWGTEVVQGLAVRVLEVAPRYSTRHKASFSSRCLFVVQGNHGVNPGRSPGRDPA